MRREFLWFGIILLTGVQPIRVWGEDRFYCAALKDVEITKGEWPVSDDAEKDRSERRHVLHSFHYFYPYASGEQGEEIYVYTENPGGRQWDIMSPERFRAISHLVIRGKGDIPPRGRLYVWKGTGAGMACLEFRMN